MILIVAVPSLVVYVGNHSCGTVAALLLPYCIALTDVRTLVVHILIGPLSVGEYIPACPGQG